MENQIWVIVRPPYRLCAGLFDPVTESVSEAVRAGFPAPSLYLGLQLARGAAAPEWG